MTFVLNTARWGSSGVDFAMYPSWHSPLQRRKSMSHPAMSCSQKSHLPQPCSVQNDIIRSLKLDPDNTFYALHPFNRVNLYYEVSKCPSHFELSRLTHHWLCR